MPNKQLPILLIGVTDLCRCLGIGKTTFFSQRSSGRFPLTQIKLGNKLLFRFAEVEAWVLHGCPDVNSWNWQPEQQNALASTTNQNEDSRNQHSQKELQEMSSKY